MGRQKIKWIMAVFFSCLKESYMTQAKTNGKTAPDNQVSIHSNIQFSVHNRRTVSHLDKAAYLKMLCQFTRLDLLVARPPDIAVTYF